MDNTPLNKKQLLDSERRATEVLFASLGVVLKRSPENAAGFVRGTKAKKNNIPLPERCKEHQKRAKNIKNDGGEIFDSIAARWLEGFADRRNLDGWFGRRSTYENARAMDRTADLNLATGVEYKIVGPVRHQMWGNTVGQARSTDAGKGGGSDTTRLRSTEAYHKASMAVKGKGSKAKGKDKDKGKGKGKDKQHKGRDAPYYRW